MTGILCRVYSPPTKHNKYTTYTTYNANNAVSFVVHYTMDQYAKLFELFGALRHSTAEVAAGTSEVSPPGIIDLKKLEERERMIVKLSELQTCVCVFAEELAKRIADSKTSYEAEISSMGAFLRAKTTAPDVSVWGTKRILGKQVAQPTRIPAPPPGFTPKNRYVRVSISDYCSIPAVKVGTFDAVCQDGDLYYVEPANHFAFRLAGHLFHGNIGEIYTNEQDPHHVKPCRFGGECTNTNCTYYHDPVYAPNKRDVRNYIASSWMYVSPHSPIKNRKNSRRFGSRPYLAVDAQCLTEEEVTRFRDQSMHDLLCNVALREILAGGAAPTPTVQSST